MRRSSWLVAGVLVVFGLLLLIAAGIGLHSTSMMGMMGSYGMMSYRGMMWTMRLWGVILALIVFAGIVGLFLACYRLIDHRNTLRCPKCSNGIHKDWEFCPYCGYHLIHHPTQGESTH